LLFVFVSFPDVAVGQDEQSLPSVACANLCRTEYSCLNCVTQCVKVSDHLSESKSDVSFDVLEEAPNRSDCGDDSAYMRPKVPLVIAASPLAGV